ncbi:PDR/VanB family oxidoreductase [Kutzneria viridogrisea]
MPDRFLRGLAVFTDVYTRSLPLLGRSRKQAGPLERALRLEVVDRRVEAEDVVSIQMSTSDGSALPQWFPGSHLDLHLASGRRRQYSLCGDPADRDSYRIAVRRITDGGGGSVEVHEELTPGRHVVVRGPRNAFPFVPHGSALFLAGGIGITPILPMVRAADRLGMDWRFVYTGRSRATMPFLDELPAGRVLVRPDEEFGVPTAADLLADAPRDGAVYVCGPTPMLATVRAGFGDCAASALHFERFAPPPVVDGKPFEVQLGRGGVVLQVPADRSALEVIREQLPGVAYSCRQGFCGTCRVRVLDGVVEHRDRRLTDRQRAEGEALVCVSRADGGRLVLDL